MILSMSLIKQLDTSFCFLFPSMLADKAVQGITSVKQNCKVVDHFDVVAQSGRWRRCWLSCYNNYDLAKEIALFPIPVITGIIMLQMKRFAK
jgi:exodeoxyribonuclease VII large subunit